MVRYILAGIGFFLIGSALTNDPGPGILVAIGGMLVLYSVRMKDRKPKREKREPE